MTRKPKDKPWNKTKNLNLRVSEAEIAAMRKQADAEGKSLSDYIRDLAVPQAKGA